MSTPVVFCAVAFTNYLSFVGYHSDLRPYWESYDSLAYLTEEASDIADKLAFCGGHEHEVTILARIGQAAAARAHALEDEARRRGLPLKY